MFVAWLERLTWLFLLAPWVPFALGWLRPWLALPLLLALAVSLRATARAGGEEPAPAPPPSPAAVAAVIALAFLWVGLSGAGGWGYQNPDWDKHNAILADLVRQRWPPLYYAIPTDPAGVSPLLYYLAYYLPAALVGKLAGWQAANQALALQTALGASLALLWFCLASGGVRLWAALLFVLFAGLDVAGAALMGFTPVDGVEHMEWWAVDRAGGRTAPHFFQYAAHTSHLFWAPQHALAGWLATALVLQRIARGTMAGVALAIAAVAIWSPFVSLGLLPFAAAGLWLTRARGAFSLANLAAPPLMLALAAAFFATSQNPAPREWLFAAAGIADWPKLWMLWIFEFGLYAIFCRRARAGERSERVLYWTAIAALLLLPLYRIGRYNDFTMRAALPSQFVLCACIARELLARRWTADSRVLLALLLLGTFLPLNEIARSFHRRPNAPTAEAQVLSVRALPPLDFARQYMGYGDSFFWRTAAAPLPRPLALAAGGDPLSYPLALDAPVEDALLLVRRARPGATASAALDGAAFVAAREMARPKRSWPPFIDEIPLGRIEAGTHVVTVAGVEPGEAPVVLLAPSPYR